MWSWLASLLTGPLIKAALDAYKAKLAAGNTADGIAADLAGKEILLQQREAELDTQIRIAEIGRWYEPDHVIGYAVAFIVVKVLVWDMCLGLGSTPEPRGWIAGITTAVIYAYFGKRGIENVLRIWARK